MMNNIHIKIFEILKQVLNKKKKIFLHEPFFNIEEKRNIFSAISKKNVSTYGNAVNVFENQLKKFIRCKFAFATVNGTAALHLALYVLGINKDCEVLIPALNFIAGTNATLYLSGTPHFIDVENKTFGPDVIKLKNYLRKIVKKKKGFSYNKNTGKRIKAIIITHVFGHPCQIYDIKKVCKEYNILIVEDAAEALGSYYKKTHVGNFGEIGIFSFNGNKIITTGGGGAIVTNSKILSKKIKKIYNTGKIAHKWEYKYSDLGFNYKMPAINAQIGIAQLKKINLFLKKKRKLFQRYEKKFKNIKMIKLLKEPKNCKSNYWLQTLILEKKSSKIKNNILKITNQKNIQTRPIWQVLTKNKYLKKYPSMKLKNSLDLANKVINLPSGPNE